MCQLPRPSDFPGRPIQLLAQNWRMTPLLTSTRDMGSVTFSSGRTVALRRSLLVREKRNWVGEGNYSDLEREEDPFT